MYKQKVNWETTLPKIKEMGSNGMTLAEIARELGVTRQRMSQIVLKHIPEWKDQYGRAVKTKKKIERWKTKWGDKTDTDLYRVQRDKFRAKKYNAEKIGYSWSISFGELEWPTHCPILGIELNYFAENRQENSASFDRIDSSKGYDYGNVQIISWRANRIKNDGTLEEHKKIVEYLDKLAQDCACKETL